MARTKQIVGLDIGARNVRAVWMSLRAGAPCAVRVESLALPADAQDATPVIQAWLQKTGLANTFCAIALPGGQAVFQPGRVPHSDPRTPKQAAAMDLVQFNEMAGDTMRNDLHAFDAPSEPRHTLYLIAMARPASIERALQVAAQMNVRPADLVPAPIALFNALDPLAGPHAQPWIYLDIGNQQTDVAIGLPQGLLFARTVPVGGRAFTDALAQASNLTPVQAEARKHALNNFAEDATFGPALRATAERWGSQVHSCLGVYRSQFSGAPFAIGQVVLTGGGARLAGLPAYLAAQLKMPVILSSDLPAAAATEGTRLWLGTADQAAGLAATALEAAPVRISMLPPALRHEIVFKEKKPYWIAAAVFVALALGLFTASGLASLHRDRQRLQIEHERLKKCELMANRIVELHRRADAVARRAGPAQKILLGGPVAREVLSAVANSINPDDWITLFCDETSYVPETPEAATPPAPPSHAPFALFRDLRTGILGSPRPPPPPTPPAAAAAVRRPVFIIEGYTPDPSLGTVKEMLGRLRSATVEDLLGRPRPPTNLVVRADLLSDDRIIPPRELPPEVVAALPHYRHFVIQLEVNTP